MRYIKLFDHISSGNIIEKIGEIESLLKEYSYILEDEGIEVDFYRNSDTISIYLNKYRLNLLELNTNLNEKDYYLEYIDRIKEICEKNGFLIEINTKNRYSIDISIN